MSLTKDVVPAAPSDVVTLSFSQQNYTVDVDRARVSMTVVRTDSPGCEHHGVCVKYATTAQGGTSAEEHILYFRPGVKSEEIVVELLDDVETERVLELKQALDFNLTVVETCELQCTLFDPLPLDEEGEIVQAAEGKIDIRLGTPLTATVVNLDSPRPSGASRSLAKEMSRSGSQEEMSSRRSQKSKTPTKIAMFRTMTAVGSKKMLRWQHPSK